MSDKMVDFKDCTYHDTARKEAAQARVVKAARALLKAMDNPHRREPPSPSPLRAALAELDREAGT